jgi:ribosomal-protein-alanine N-acetyltransferase
MLKTDRLTLRELESQDLQLIHALHSLPETDEFNTLGIPETILVTEDLLTDWLSKQQEQPRDKYVLAIELNDTKKFAGLIGLNHGKPKFRSAEVWFKIHKDFWSKGYTTEALKRLLTFGFNELNLHRIEAGCAVENNASARVLEKAGMIREGRKRKNLPIRGEWKDNFSYAILEEDFFAPLSE